MVSITKESFAIVTIFICVIAVIALLANAAVILAYIKCKQLRKSTNYFAINLATTDICIILGPLSIWMVIMWYNYTLFVFGGDSILSQESIFSLYKFWTFIDSTLINVSVTNLAFLSLERYFAITMPLRHRVYTTPRKMQMACIATWLVSLIVMAPSFAFKSTSFQRYIHKALPALVCCLVMTLTYVLLLRKVCTKRCFDEQINVRQQRRKRRELMLSLRLSLLTVTFLICWVPLTIFSLWISCNNNQNRLTIKDYMILIPILKLLSYFHSFLNPFLYIYGRPAFARVLQGLFCCKRTHALDEIVVPSIYASNKPSKCGEVNSKARR